MTETNAIRRIDPENLKSIGDKTVISKYVAVNHATAHPHVLEDGTVYNVGTSYRHKKGPQYVVVKVPPTFGSKDTSYEGAKIVAEIPFTTKRHPAYYHSFGITKDYIVFIESPLKLDILKLATSALTNISFHKAMTWDANLKTRFYVASLTDGKVHPVVYESDAFFTFHHINTYEEDGQIVVDVAAYDTGDIVLKMENDRVNEKSNTCSEATARRFVLPLNVSTASEGQNLVTLKDSQAKATLKGESNGKPSVFCEPQHLTKDWMELPRINYLHNAKSYNFFYAISSEKNKTWTTIESDTITKVDIKNDKCINWSEEGMIPSEPIFVANPNSKNKDEDDGVVLSALMHENDENRVSLLILDAKNMKELAKVKFETAGAFTGTFHGQWANQADKIHLY
jgi:carotenoid cleavage dioxygenase-like enzyme